MPRFSLESALTINDQMSGGILNVQRRMNRATDAMSRQTRAASTQMRQSLAGASRGFGALRAAAGLALAAVTTGRIARGITELAAAGDEISKMATQLGVGAEALQELRFAADRSGVTTAELETSLGALNTRLGQLRNDQGSLATMLRGTNPELMAQLNAARSTEDAFMLLMDAMHGTEDAMQRAALAEAAFGRSGRSLLRMANEGADGIQALRDQAQSLGIVMSEEAAQRSAEFVDQLTNLKAVGRGVMQSALLPMMDAVIPIVQQIVAWTQANKDLIRQGIDQFFERLRNVAQIIARHWQSGLIPAILAGVAAFQVLLPLVTGTVAAFRAFRALRAAGGLMSWLASGPIGLIIGAVVALGVGVYMLIRHWDTVRAWLTAFWQKWGDWIAGALAVFMPFIGIPVLIVQHWDTISTFFAGLWRTVSTGVVAFVGNMRDRFIETRDRITEAWSALTETFTQIGGNIRDAIVSGFESARDTVMTVWQNLIDWFQAALEPITRIIDGTVGKVQDVVGRARDIGGGIRDRVSGIFGGGDDAPRNRDHGAYASPTTATAETRSYSERVQRSEVWLRADRGTSMSQTRGGLVEQSLMLGVQ